MELTEHGNNANIKINVLPEKEMRALGFTDYREGYWYFCKILYEGGDISFDLTVNKNDPSDWYIDVLLDDFCQPYDYQYLMTRNVPMAFKIRDKVEEIMRWLTNQGIVEGWKEGDYI